jgi:hypothetical protein
LALIVAMALAGGSALAQPVDDATRQAARTLAEAGLIHFDEGRFEAALAKFNAAAQLLPTPTLSVMSARCLAKLGRLTEASNRYREAIDMPLGPDAPQLFKDIKVDARKELDALAPRFARLEIAVGAGAAPVEVQLDGKPVPASSLGTRLPLDPGVHQIEIQRGAERRTEEVNLHEGESRRIEASPPTPPPPPAPGDPGATQRTLGFIGLGVGGAGLVAFGVAGSLALVKNGELADACDMKRQCPHGAADTLATYNTLRTISTAGIIVGVVGVAAGSLLVALAPKQAPQAARVRVLPSLGLGSVGVTGTF